MEKMEWLRLESLFMAWLATRRFATPSATTAIMSSTLSHVTTSRFSTKKPRCVLQRTCGMNNATQ